MLVDVLDFDRGVERLANGVIPRRLRLIPLVSVGRFV
jgi:hypothetical protein